MDVGRSYITRVERCWRMEELLAHLVEESVPVLDLLRWRDARSWPRRSSAPYPSRRHNWVVHRWFQGHYSRGVSSEHRVDRVHDTLRVVLRCVLERRGTLRCSATSLRERPTVRWRREDQHRELVVLHPITPADHSSVGRSDALWSITIRRNGSIDDVPRWISTMGAYPYGRPRCRHHTPLALIWETTLLYTSSTTVRSNSMRPVFFDVLRTARTKDTGALVELSKEDRGPHICRARANRDGCWDRPQRRLGQPSARGYRKVCMRTPHP